MRLKGTKFWLAVIVLAPVVAVLVACGDTIVNVGAPTQINNQSQGPQPDPNASPSPGATGLVATCSFGPFGAEVPAGKTKPPNSQRPYPVYIGGSAIATITGRTAENEQIHDVRVSGKFPEVAVVGKDVLAVEVNLGSNSDGYNFDLIPLKAGSATARATLKPSAGAPVSCELEVQVVP